MARKLKIMENETQTLFDLEYGEKHSETLKMLNAYCRTWNMVRKLKIMEMWKMRNSQVGPGIWRETEKNMKNEKYILLNLDYGEKTENHGK
jgi:hypothetical protein